ncbi:MAG: hypothetical protein IJX13_00145, partial [Clostridia bacterium]|nr:hypothetical protein [Clostridia bacterium]
MKNKTKLTVRLLALLLAVLTVLPMSWFSVAAATTLSFGKQNFESLTTDKALTTADGFAAVPVYSSAKQESNGQNKYAHIPFVGGEAPSNTSNWDKSLQVNHQEIKAGTNFTIEISYRPHYGGSGAPTLEAQFLRYGFTDNGTPYEGIFFNLFTIDVKSGVLTSAGTLVQGAEGMILDEWNTVKVIFQSTEGRLEIYVNNKLYSVKENFRGVDSSWEAHTNVKDISVHENMLIVGKCNKNKGAYTATEGADTSYVDVDNVKIYETPDYE